MKHWKESDEPSADPEIRIPTETEINMDNIVQILEYIKGGYLPDWNYKTNKNQDGTKTSLPDEYYPLHIAMDVAIKAVKLQDDAFFASIDAHEKQ